MRFSLVALIFILLPTSALAADIGSASKAPSSFSATRSILSVASSSPGNAYLAGASIVVTAPVNGDLSAIGGSIVSAAPVSGDELLFAGSISSRSRVHGDFRALGWSINIENPIGGDLVVLGYSVRDLDRASGSTLIIAANTTLENGASGPVTIYGNNVSLAGDFADNVTIVASGRVALAASTTIAGKLSYESPEETIIPASVKISGGVEYTNASYLPDAGTSRILTFISMGFFLFVRILGALILAGLLAGLFPKLSEDVANRAYTRRSRDILLTTLLGFAILVATPIFLIILSLTFVGIGIALLLFILYFLMALLSVVYAGIFLGGVLARRFALRSTILWRDGVLGMLILSLVTLIPTVGFFAVLLLTLFSAGALLQIFFNFAFPHDER